MMKILRHAALAAFALVAVAAVSTPSYAKVDDRGVRTEKMDASDKVTKKEVISASAPTDGTASIPVTVTTSYLHKNWFWQNDEVYKIKTPATAEYVVRLDNWMLKDTDGSLFRFSKGSNVGMPTTRQTIDIGTLSALMSSGDSGIVAGVSSGAVSSDGSSRSLNVTYKYTHAETYNDVTYTYNGTASATFVAEQGGHMAWIGSTLYKVNAAGQVQSLREKPTANIGARDKMISNRDQSVSWEPTVSAGSTSYNGRTRVMNVSKDYIHEETFQKLRYSIVEEVDATFVSEQKAHMVWVENKLYRVRVGSDDVVQLSTRPVVNVGEKHYKLDFNDSLVTVQVNPLSVTSDSKSILVSVRRIYRHAETFQVLEYFKADTQIATYNETYKAWTVIVDGRIYAITFDGTVVNNDGSVVVITAPGGMKRPDVVVVKPNGEDPPVVVPGKRKPPVVDTDNDPPVVVPGKRKPPVVMNDNDDGPPVVVPRR